MSIFGGGAISMSSFNDFGQLSGSHLSFWQHMGDGGDQVLPAA
jgi:hypothetical protein